MNAFTDTITRIWRSVYGVYIYTKSNLRIVSTYKHRNTFTTQEINNILKINTPVEILIVSRDNDGIQMSIPGFVLIAEHSKELSVKNPTHVFTSCKVIK